MNTEKINRRMQELTDSGEMAAGTLMISQNHTCIFQGKWGIYESGENDSCAV